MVKLVLAFVALSAIVIPDASCDVTHLPVVSTDRQYLPPHDQHSEKSTQYAPYKVIKVKGIADPPLVRHERARFSPGGHIRRTVGPKSQLFTKAARATQYNPVYTSAPNSVFHTQINVQSQGSEFNAPNIARQINNRLRTEELAPFLTIRNQNLNPGQNRDLAVPAHQPGDAEASNNEALNGEFYNGEDHNGEPAQKVLSMPAGKSQRRPVSRPEDDGLHGSGQRGVEHPSLNGPHRSATQQQSDEYNQRRKNAHRSVESTGNNDRAAPRDTYADDAYNIRNRNTSLRANAPRSFAEMDNGVLESDDNEPVGSLGSSGDLSQSLQRKSILVSKAVVAATYRSAVGRKRPQKLNYQGVNLIKGNIIGSRGARAKVPRPGSNYNGNSQGINIINGNLLANDDADSTTGEGDLYAATSSHSPQHRVANRGYRDDDPITLPSANAFDVIYKAGNNPAYFEGTSSEFGDVDDIGASLDTVASTPMGTTQGQRTGGHDHDTDLRDDGYYYGKPSITFRS